MGKTARLYTLLFSDASFNQGLYILSTAGGRSSTVEVFCHKEYHLQLLEQIACQLQKGNVQCAPSRRTSVEVRSCSWKRLNRLLLLVSPLTSPLV